MSHASPRPARSAARIVQQRRVRHCGGAFQFDHHRGAELLARLCYTHDLVETAVERPRALPVQRKIRQHARQGIAILNALAGFRQFDRAVGDDGSHHGQDSRRALRRRGCTERLARTRLAAATMDGGRLVTKSGSAKRIGRERHSAFIHALRN